MKKLVLFFLFCIPIYNSIYCQSESLHDIFPLEVGKQYYYDFNLHYVYIGFSSIRDTGLVNYQIIDKSEFVDSTIWQFKQIRGFTRYAYSYGQTTISWIEDSKYFKIVEKHQGLHELYTPEFDGYSLFPFFKNAPDSDKFYRYIDTIINGRIGFSSFFKPDPSMIYFTYNVKYSLAQDTGIVTSKARLQGEIVFYYTTAFYLRQVFTDIDSEIINTPKGFYLSQNYPNPFNPGTDISYQLPVAGIVTLKVYDVLGNEVATLVDEYKNAGNYEVEFKSTVGIHQLANGVYFYRLQAGDFVETKKMILLK